MLPEHPKTMWPVAEDAVRSPDVSAWKSTLYDVLPSADGFRVLSVDGTMKIAMGVRGRDAGTPLTPGGSQQDRLDPNTCVVTTRTLQGAVLDLGAQRKQTPCCRVRPGERGTPQRAGACALGGRGQRAAGVARLPVVFISVSSGRRAGHTSSDEVRGCGLASRFSWLQDASKFNVSFPSEVCPDVDAPEPFRGERNHQLMGDEVLFHDHLCHVSWGAPCCARGAGRGTAVTRSTCRVAASQSGFTKKHPFFTVRHPRHHPHFLLFLHLWCFQHRFGQKKFVEHSMFAIRFLCVFQSSADSIRKWSRASPAFVFGCI